jgi:ribosomal protein S12 methylthiotransferase
VLIDTVSSEGVIARSSADAPEIDGVVRIEPSSSSDHRSESRALPAFKAGQFVRVRITGADDHDLTASPCEDVH